MLQCSLQPTANGDARSRHEEMITSDFVETARGGSLFRVGVQTFRDRHSKFLVLHAVPCLALSLQQVLLDRFFPFLDPANVGQSKSGVFTINLA